MPPDFYDILVGNGGQSDLLFLPACDDYFSRLCEDLL